MTINNIIAAGCSFTQDGLGGMPPTQDSAGGNSFLPDPSYTVRVPRSWASVMAQDLGARSFVNVAAASHGNMVTSLAVQYLLEHYAYSHRDTLVVFNITTPSRFDVVCDHGCKQQSPHIPWGPDVIPFQFLHRQSSVVQKLQNYMNLDQLENNSLSMIQSLMRYLAHRGFEFRFLTMRDYRSITAFQDIMQEFRTQSVQLGASQGMIEYCAANDLAISPSDFHPSDIGHRHIAAAVIQSL